MKVKIQQLVDEVTGKSKTLAILNYEPTENPKVVGFKSNVKLLSGKTVEINSSSMSRSTGVQSYFY